MRDVGQARRGLRRADRPSADAADLGRQAPPREGIDQVADYMNAQPRPDTLTVATRYRSSFGPLLEGRALTIQAAGEAPFDPEARPIWEVISEIGASVPDEEWAKVPTDLARNLDHYLYGVPKQP